MTEDFILFEEYAKCVQECLKNIVHDYQMAKDSEPLVIYATAPIAYAKAQEHFANGTNVGPLITFYQSGMEVDHNVQMGAWKVLPVERDEGNYLYRAPIICKITYTVTINALTELEADMLQAQIMQATPFHRPYYTKFNGNFVLIESTDYKNLSSVEAGENKDKVSRREITLVIDRAYINYDIRELNAGTISPAENTDDSDDYYNGIEIREKLKDGSLVMVDGNIIKAKEKLKNGATVMEDGGVLNGKETKNTSADGFSPFNYNVLDDSGNVIGVTQKGKVKVTLFSIENKKS